MDSQTVSVFGVQAPRNTLAPRELGLIERASGVAGGLKSLHTKLGDLRDKIEGNGVSGMSNAQTEAMPGLPSQLSESESILRACHSLLDDLAGKF